MNRFTWRGMFILIGGASLIWLLPWSLVAAKLPTKRIERASAWAPTYSQLVTKRRLWGTVVGLFGGNYVWYFFLTWLPYYFETERHFTRNTLALLASLPFWAVAIASMLFGLLADALIRRGRDAGRVRQTFCVTGLFFCCAFMFPAVLVRNAYLSIFLMMMSAISMAGFSSNHWALSQRLSGVAAAGKWTGFQNCLGNFAGVAGAWITGRTLYLTHSFFLAFAIACGITLVGALGYLLIIGKPDEVRWHEGRLPAMSGEMPDDVPPQKDYQYQPLPPTS
jgi:MFS transporter, ACS family, D-galactonate transporter